MANIEELGLTDGQLEAVKRYGQGEADKVRTELSRKNKELTEELNKYKPREKSDAEKALEERITALENREKELANKEKTMTIANKLKEKELPEGLAKYLIIGDDMDNAIDEIGALFGNYFLNGSNKPTNHQTNKGVTKEDFKKMSYSQRAKLYADNLALYQALIK